MKALRSVFDSLFGTDDEPEMMPVAAAALGEGFLVGCLALGVEHPGLLGIPRHPLAFEIGDVGGERSGVKETAAVAGNARLDHDAAG